MSAPCNSIGPRTGNPVPDVYEREKCGYIDQLLARAQRSSEAKKISMAW